MEALDQSIVIGYGVLLALLFFKASGQPNYWDASVTTKKQGSTQDDTSLLGDAWVHVDEQPKVQEEEDQTRGGRGNQLKTKQVSVEKGQATL
mmetsp:Transcript_23389/g.53961  ORF Transcript_23389/g.53961 Transcript_23389/m.53961 type:complete len:92 (-) Transcript_23389:1061-1336(-)|eukprot:CAMPEP_0182574338 /NCGR_PEP_ID=MMETSP1324-20130603/24677_1 /TAXON_ID=236786 /ORGANISM="Florenciella sp., Strain RCC1587" /LENGTH=91 /DNA_ID=CAMNT_0024789675 /DNA_START=85 /DNA_END=360 /DNA_ORIENTATION=+